MRATFPLSISAATDQLRALRIVGKLFELVQRAAASGIQPAHLVRVLETWSVLERETKAATAVESTCYDC